MGLVCNIIVRLRNIIDAIFGAAYLIAFILLAVGCGHNKWICKFSVLQYYMDHIIVSLIWPYYLVHLAISYYRKIYTFYMVRISEKTVNLRVRSRKDGWISSNRITVSCRPVASMLPRIDFQGGNWRLPITLGWWLWVQNIFQYWRKWNSESYINLFQQKWLFRWTTLDYSCIYACSECSTFSCRRITWVGLGLF